MVEIQSNVFGWNLANLWSRNSDGNVPNVNWNSDNDKLQVNWNNPDNANDNLRGRVEVSK